MIKYRYLLFILFISNILGAQTNYGSLDNSFMPNDVGYFKNHGSSYTNSPSSGVSDFHIHPDGKVTVSGSFGFYDGHNRPHVVRLKPDLSIDPSFRMDFGIASGSWTGLLLSGVQSTNKVIIGGRFNFYSGSSSQWHNLARLNTNGFVDQFFAAGGNNSGTNDDVTDMELQSDDKTIIVGRFTNYMGTFVNHILRLTAGGSKDNTFNVGSGITSNFISSYINRVKILSDGKLLVAGQFTSWNNLPYKNIVRLNNNGSLDTTFQSGLGPLGMVEAIHELPNGKIAIGGSFTSYDGISCPGFCILNPDGTLDSSFSSGSGFSGTVKTICADTNNIYVGGSFTSYNGNNSPYFACISHTGTWNPAFVSQFDKEVRVIKSLPDGSIMLGGLFYGFGDYAIHGLARIMLTGEIDTTFNRNTGGGIAIDGTQKFDNGDEMVFGTMESFNGILVPSHVAKVDSVGTVYHDNFRSLPFERVCDVVVESPTKVLIGGKLRTGTPLPFEPIIRTDEQGNIDPGFNSGITFSSSLAIVYDIKMLPGGSYIVLYQNGNNLFISKLNNDGSIDNGFTTSQMSNSSLNIDVLDNGKILLYGSSFTINSGPSRTIVRLNTDGTVDAAFNSGVGANDRISKVKEFDDGRLFVGGYFTTWNSSPQRGYIVLNQDGTVFNGFDYPLNYTQYQYVQDAVMLANGKIMIAGKFGLDTLTSHGVLLLYPDGTVDQNFKYRVLDSELNGEVYSLEETDSSSFTIGGRFRSVNGVGANCIERFSYHSLPMVHDTITACDSFSWINGVTYFASQDSIYYSTPSANGADSLIMLSLIINYSSDTTLNIAVCESYYWDIPNQTYYSSQTIIDTIPNHVGCDSIITLNLTIYPIYNDTTDVTQCGSYHWNQTGLDYQLSGYYSDSLQSVFGCDSVITLNLTILNTSNTISETSCDSYLWPINGQTYTVSGQYIDTILNAVGCDSIITLDLTIIPSLPLILENTFSMPSDANTCVGEVAIDLSGNADFELNIDNGSQVITSSGYSLVTNLCAGVHDLHVTDHCGDTLSTQIVIPVDSNYVFNNPFIDSLAIDSLGVTATNCDIYYNSIDTAYIDSIWANGNTVNVIWNIVDPNGSNFDTTTYVLNNGSGVYWLQLSVFCPNKSIGEYFTVTQAIYFNNGSVSTVGLSDYKQTLFEVYPNPTNNQVHISFSGSDAELTVYDLQGKIVLKDRIQNQGTVSLENFERGVYLFDFRNSQGQSVQRVVKH